MVKRPDIDWEGAAVCPPDAGAAARVDGWFEDHVLPLEPLLMQFLERNWRNASEIADLRQEVYVRVYQAALKQLPEKPRQFVFATARNLLIDRVRHESVIPIDAAADLETLDIESEAPGPERAAIARDELRRLQAALDHLPPRCRQAVVMARIEDRSRSEIARAMGVAEITVSQYLTQGICALTDFLAGNHPKRGRKT